MRHSKIDEKRRDLARQVRGWTVEAFHDQLAEAGVHHAYVIFENGEFALSHPKLLAPVQAFFELSQDFAEHEAVFIGREDGIPTLFFAAVHNTRRGLAQGGLRFKPYATLADVLADNLRLAHGMTRKNALAGLWWGGGKGVIPITRALEAPAYRDLESRERLELFRAYGRFVASLGGVYYTAEDVGTKTSDMNALHSQNRFTTCIATEHGGSGNPSPFTARGVFRGMQAGWSFLTGSDDLAGVRVAVQGVGNVGGPLIEELLEAGAAVWVSDIDRQAMEELAARRPQIEIVDSPDDIYDLDVDVLAPCAIGAVVNRHTIPRLKVKLVCGAANNILAERMDAERLRERGIAYVPDYLCNRMGVTNCCDESFGYLREDVELAAERVYPDSLRVLRHAARHEITTSEAADQLADLAACELHPMIGHRGRRLIDHLVASDWAEVRRGRRPSAGGRSASAAVFDPPRDEAAIRVRWEREARFRGRGPAIAAAPISAAGRPDLSSFLSAVLMDVRARALELLGGERSRRVAGSDHGGLALELAVERSLSYEHQEVGRARFTERCMDAYRRQDAAIRDQLHQLGVGFDPSSWLDLMSPAGSRVVRRLYLALKDAGLLYRERRRSYFDTVQQTELLAPGEDPVRSIRGRRTSELEDCDVSEHLFVRLDESARHLERAIATGAVVFSADRWRDRVLQAIESPEPWTISRHQWWGHPLPDGPDGDDAEVLSVWFALVAWAFRALRWPEVATPEPIAEVYVDPDLLMRWVVPSQLVALFLTGRPAFRRVEVHGALHVPVRILEALPDVAEDELDEERFIVDYKRQLVRRQPGSAVEPQTLIRRFGADALRLGYLLSIHPGSPEIATASESHLKEARRAVQRLGAKVSGLYRLIAMVSSDEGHEGPSSKARPGDEEIDDTWILGRSEVSAAKAREALAEGRLSDAGRLFTGAVDDFGRYAAAAAKSRDPEALVATGATVAEVVRRLDRGFSPVCPYLFDKLAAWTGTRAAALAEAPRKLAASTAEP